MKIESNSRQIPKVERYCANKKYNDLLYGYLQEISVKVDRDIGAARLVPKSEVNYVQLGKKFNLSRQTVAMRFKNLLELGLIAEWEEDNRYYQLLTLEQNVAALIPYKTLKLMVDSLSTHSISTYVYFLNRYVANGEKEFIFTYDQIKAYIGISVNTRSNDETVANILFTLKNLRLIDIELTTLDGLKTVYKLKWVVNKISEC